MNLVFYMDTVTHFWAKRILCFFLAFFDVFLMFFDSFWQFCRGLNTYRQLKNVFESFFIAYDSS